LGEEGGGRFIERASAKTRKRRGQVPERRDVLKQKLGGWKKGPRSKGGEKK